MIAYNLLVEQLHLVAQLRLHVPWYRVQRRGLSKLRLCQWQHVAAAAIPTKGRQCLFSFVHSYRLILAGATDGL